jgi:tetratricopeptide (TPR) repeat protein
MLDEAFRRTAVACAYLALGGLLAAPVSAGDEKTGGGKIPITTQSEEALKLFIEGRDLAEKLRGTDGRELLQEAVAKDEDFALCHLALANTAPSNKEFFASVSRAMALADKVSEAERHMILAANAGARSDPAAQREHLTTLAAAYPNDERAQNLLAGFHFGRQEYEEAIAAYQKAIAVNERFSPPYNQMGYAYRFLGNYAEAEQAIKKYIALIPDDPNPYDSYAELLMKMGRFEESIAQYEKALALDANFVASYVGIGINQTLMGQPEKARGTFGKLQYIARNSGERRQGLARMAWSYVDEGQHEAALVPVAKMHAIAERNGDQASMAGDLVLMGNILLDAGKLDEAQDKFTEAVEVMARAKVPTAVKEAARRNSLFNLGRVELAKNDLAAAKASSETYAKTVDVKQVPFEVRQSHELAGLVALAAKDYPEAIAELKQANQQNPRVLYSLALAYQGNGDAERAKKACRQAADFNSLNFNYAYVRTKARKMLDTM